MDKSCYWCPSPAQDYLSEEFSQETRYETALGTRNVASCRYRDADWGLGRKPCRLLKGLKSCKKKNALGIRLKLEMALDELPELFAVFVAHVNELHAASIWADGTNHGGEINLAEPGTNLQLD
jgi:hypothetical protein